MTVGFTGTHHGMSEAQEIQLSWLFRMALRGVTQFHHGGCIGADRQAQAIAAQSAFSVVVHPCPGVTSDGDIGTNGRGRFCHYDVAWREVLPPLTRNRRIVAECDILIAAPRADKEELRSGTWATVRYARQAGKPVIMLSRGGQA